MRLLSLIAIQEQNAGLAGIIKKASETTDALEAFRQGIIAAIRAIIDKVQGMQAAIIGGTVGGSAGGGTSPGSINPMDPYYGNTPSPSSTFYTPKALELQKQFNSSPSSSGFYSTPTVNISINPAVAGLIDVIQNQSASGISPTVNRVSSSYIA
jgi:hypothetical protein